MQLVFRQRVEEVLAAGVLLLVLLLGPGPTQAIEEYDQLAHNYRVGVDLVSQQLQSYHGVQLHFRFFRTVGKAEIESGFGASYLFHHFYLKATSCAKGTASPTALTCPFRNNRPLMDCAVCYKIFNGGIEAEPKPYVHCIQKPKLTQEMRETRLDHCRRMILYERSAHPIGCRYRPR
ncbi:hypothetical protein CRUP_029830 [Coryphaenoides rupestris]|nr:hypothetical protein CRUP_029830 [Coryphaenoides rupestris]